MLSVKEAMDAVFNQGHYLEKCGWIKSYLERVAVQPDGTPVPWYSYASVEFLGPRLNKDMKVFEFGCGHSTLWYAERVGHVISVEEKKPWFDRVHERIPGNAQLVLCPSVGDYVYHITQFKNFFDIIVIDGLERELCAKVALSSLKDDGVIIWDNANHKTQSENKFFPGFKRIDFYGLTPVCTYGNCTSIFYREENCLGI